MKKFLFALAAAILLVGQLFSPVAAASSGTVTAEDCGDTYIVQPGDYLSAIARTCGISLSNILVLNPQITSPNLIYAGQVLRLTDAAPTASAPIYYPYTSTTSSGYASVSLSTPKVAAGNSLTVSISGFPAYADIDYRVGQQGDDYSIVYDGSVDSDGAASKTITIPSSADSGEYWVVYVVTTGQKSAVGVTSHWIYITNDYTSSSSTTSSGYAKVSLSTTTVDAGDNITVYVSGFPANASLDYRIGEQGEDYTAVYDGSTDSSGSDDATVTIPSTANAGEYWVISVQTTDQVNGVTVLSHTIYITD
jgi:LysM repeat protein